MFKYETQIRFPDIDLAGTMFFANHQKLAHEAYEALLRAHNLHIADIIEKSDYLIPVIRAETDYKKLIDPRETLTVVIALSKKSRCSFTLDYQILKESGELSSHSLITHVVIDRKTHKAIPLPDEICAILETLN